jgi:acetyl esterase/lipase
MFAARQEAAGSPAPTIEESRAAVEARFGRLPPGGGASCADVDLAGVSGEWTIPGSPTIAGTMLYFHGGAYFMGSIATHRRLVTSLCVAAAALRSRVALYVPEGDPRQPLASPLFADLTGLPPVLVQVGGAEILYDDSTRLAEKARALGVDSCCGKTYLN